ncbi:hypothetical protein F4212_08505 [Candidatus Poribacteria bacterium]|nr:hypothetical protein [Candidatus Poribacteria bacterium]
MLKTKWTYSGNMKLILWQFWMLSITTLVIPTLFVGCASPKPSKSVVKELIAERLRQNVPLSYTAGEFQTRMATRNLKIHSVKITEWGNFNKSRKYWPAKIRVVGSVDGEFLTGFAKTTWKKKEFDKTDNFIFYKDDYGKWKISTP